MNNRQFDELLCAVKGHEFKLLYVELDDLAGTSASDKKTSHYAVLERSKCKNLLHSRVVLTGKELKESREKVSYQAMGWGY